MHKVFCIKSKIGDYEIDEINDKNTIEEVRPRTVFYTRIRVHVSRKVNLKKVWLISDIRKIRYCRKP